MPRRALAMLVLALLLAAVPTAAQAKGATAANISGGGPGGLPRGPIDLKGDGEPGSGSNLANLAEAAGVWALLFEDGQPGNLVSAPLPASQRGPRYTITWTFPNGAGTEDKVRQSVWPYAPGGPITYMPAGQKVLDTKTEGGWFRAADNLRQSLVTLGLPDRPALTAPAASAPAPAAPAAPAPAPAPGPSLWPWVVAGAGLLLVVAAATLARRRVVGRRSPGGASAS
jgi:hypothetical protein